MLFLGIVIILILVYFLIIRPLTKNRYPQDRYYRPPTYGPQGGSYYGNPPEYGGIGRGFGMMAGGFAAGALLTYLLEQGRIDPAQFDYFNSLDQGEMIRQLQEQNIIQQQEIDSIMNQIGSTPDLAPTEPNDGYFDFNDDGGGFDNSDGGFDNSGGGDWV